MRERTSLGPMGGRVPVQVAEPDAALLALDRRLSRIEGQLRGIRRMVRQPRPCTEIAQQLAAARSALRCVTVAMFARCVPAPRAASAPMDRRDADRQVTRLLELIDRLDQTARSDRSSG